MSVSGAARPRLVDVTTALDPGVVTVIVGPSGAGKSTLLRLCNRLEVADRGTVRFRGDDVATVDPLALRRRVAMVFQRPTPFPGTVLDNLRVAEPALDRMAGCHALAHVGLDDSLVDRDALELSGGEAQRLCLARALVTGPEVVLLDEPTSSLDPAATAGLEALGRSLVDAGISVVWVTHDLDQMRRVGDRVLVLLDGRVAHTGPIAALETDAGPAVSAFLDGGTS